MEITVGEITGRFHFTTNITHTNYHIKIVRTEEIVVIRT